MTLSQKYGLVALFGVLAIVAANAANISDFLNGIVTGFAIAFMVYCLYKMVTCMKAEKEDNKDTKAKKSA